MGRKEPGPYNPGKTWPGVLKAQILFKIAENFAKILQILFQILLNLSKFR